MPAWSTEPRTRYATVNALLSCTVVVGEANAVGAPVHDRMVVILGPGDYAAWLDPRTERATLVAPLATSDET